jgi:hypothetical protein
MFKLSFVLLILPTIPPISTKQKKALTVMVNNSTNIKKTKESLNIDGQQFYQYINKTKESLNSDGQEFHQKLSFVLLILVELLTITV